MSIYLDHNATTPLDERVVDIMRPYWRERYGNPSSLHRPGRLARDALDRESEQVAAQVNAHPSQVIFTSSGTEANNFALAVFAFNAARGRLAVSAVEHASLLGPARALAHHGWGLDYISVDDQGRDSAVSLDAALIPETRLVSVMWSNIETGVIQDVAAISAAARAAGAVMHCDAVQAFGFVLVVFVVCGVQLMRLFVFFF